MSISCGAVEGRAVVPFDRRELHAELQTKNYPFLNPGIDPSPGDD